MERNEPGTGTEVQWTRTVNYEIYSTTDKRTIWNILVAIHLQQWNTIKLNTIGVKIILYYRRQKILHTLVDLLL